MNDINKKYLITKGTVTRVIWEILFNSESMFDAYYEKRKVIEEELLTKSFDIDAIQRRLKDAIKEDFIAEFTDLLLEETDGYECPQIEIVR